MTWKSSFIVLTLQILILQCSLIMTAHLNPSRSSVANGIDLVEAVDTIFNNSDVVPDDWVPCPDGRYCEPDNTCCDGDGDNEYECCPHLSVRNHFISHKYRFLIIFLIFNPRIISSTIFLIYRLYVALV